MIDYEKIRDIKEHLTDSLVNWKSESDGFYHSAPIVGDESSPSFTNTGIVLQAFNEGGHIHNAHELANSLLDYLEKNDFKPFPHEKATGDNIKSHILCNSWPIFSILDCYPTKVEILTPLCKWFLDIQNENGSWNLLPNETTKYPLFTAYSLSVLLQFKICYETKSKEAEIIIKIDKALKEGLNWLLENRADLARQEKLLLWPASLNSLQQNSISFSTSAIAMHMFSKAGRHFNNYEWIQMAENTFSAICDKFSVKTPEIITIEGMRINIWDQIHVNESSLNYYFSFFSPINLTTLLKLAESSEFKFTDKYVEFITYFVDWIIDNSVEDGNVFGVRGGKHLEEIKTWSTAQSVIVLSRILNTAYVLLPKINSYQSDLQDKELNRLKECLINEKELNKKHQKFVTSATKFLNEEYLSDKSIKSIKLFGNLVFLALCLCALFFLKDPIQTVWPKVEGLIWLIAQIVVIISAWFSAQCH